MKAAVPFLGFLPSKSGRTKAAQVIQASDGPLSIGLQGKIGFQPIRRRS